MKEMTKGKKKYALYSGTLNKTSKNDSHRGTSRRVFQCGGLIYRVCCPFYQGWKIILHVWWSSCKSIHTTVLKSPVTTYVCHYVVNVPNPGEYRNYLFLSKCGVWGLLYFILSKDAYWCISCHILKANCSLKYSHQGPLALHRCE